MKITKYAHACLFLEKDDQTLVIDPGCFTVLPKDLPENISAIVVTEEHADHFELKNLKLLLEANPLATIFTTQAVADTLKGEGIEAQITSGEQQVTAGNFNLKFNETPHAPVHQVSPCQSLAIQVDDILYYPSDSYKTTENVVAVLALPTSGPWYKMTESIDFANAIKSSKIIPTHNALNSDSGNEVAKKYIVGHLTDKNREWIDLENGQSTEI